MRLPSRNWMIFLSITGGFASAVIYDKYQTRRIREKWCKLVSHLSEEPLSTHELPRRMTVHLTAAPGDGLRGAREHFVEYVKPILVAASMDWDVIEGRREGDVRHKTAEKIRKRRKRGGEGEPLTQEEMESTMTIDAVREKNGTREYEGVSGDLVIGRNTWKEYMRGLHEGWLGPADPLKEPAPEASPETPTGGNMPGHASLGDAAAKAAAETVVETLTPDEPTGDAANETSPESPQSDEKPAEEKKEPEEEKPKRRQPLPYIQPSEYSGASPSPQIPEVIGPSTAIGFPHLLGFRNTPIRIYRFLTRRYLADSIGRDVAAAILASHRPYETSPTNDASDGGSEPAQVLAHEEHDWWKTTYKPREEHEESVWIENMTLDERITSRMRRFQLTQEDENTAKAIWEGKRGPSKTSGET